MRILITTAAILGGLLLVAGLIGLVAGFEYTSLFLITAAALLIVVMGPMLAIYRYRQNKRMDEILQNYKGKEHQTIGSSKEAGQGWNMNSSPFRERKSGLSWEGGNIKASGAKRGSRRKFLK